MHSADIRRLAEMLLAEYRRLPVLYWELRDRGYTSPDQRTFSDALKYKIYINCNILEEIKEKLRPDEHEIVVIVTINAISRDRAKLRKIAADILKCAQYRYYASFLEPTFDGLPHGNLLIRLHRRQLARFEKALDELGMELFQQEGFAGIIDLGLCDSDSWHNHKEGHWPWPLGYCAKSAYNLDYILSFSTWIQKNGGRWYSESQRCIRTDPTPYGFVPADLPPNLPTKSTHRKSATPAAPAADVAETAQDSPAMTYGRTLHRRWPDLIQPDGSPRPDLEQKYSEAVWKCLRSRDESTLAIIRSSISPEVKDSEETTPKSEAEARISRLWGMFRGHRGPCRQISKLQCERHVVEIATEIAEAVIREDKETLGKYGLDLRNSLVYDPREITRLRREIASEIEKYDGATEIGMRPARDLIRDLNKHLHTLKLASVHNEINDLRDRIPRMHGRHRERAESALASLMKKIGSHKKATAQGHHLKNAIVDAIGGSTSKLLEKSRGTDLRSKDTRAKHGRKALPAGAKIVNDSSEAGSRQRTKSERELELLCALEAEESKVQKAAEKAAKAATAAADRAAKAEAAAEEKAQKAFLKDAVTAARTLWRDVKKASKKLMKARKSATPKPRKPRKKPPVAAPHPIDIVHHMHYIHPQDMG